MCFNTLPTIIKAKKATKNIIAYKVLRQEKSTDGTITLVSPMKICNWQIGKINTASLAKKLPYKGANINVGLHCCKTSRGAKATGFSGIVVPVVIPKGSYYYENDKQYVSDKMFVVSSDLASGVAILKQLGIITAKN